jgi:DNA-nicking Smr family endonuclease
VRPPRGLTAEEAAAWARVADTVKPYHPPPRAVDRPPKPLPEALTRQKPRSGSPPPSRPSVPAREAIPRGKDDLDSHWDRRFRSGSIEPDFTLDLHGHTLDQAHDRLIDGFAQARAMGARVILLIAGKQRPVAAADRANRRGAIRANVLDWLAASSHASAIASIRNAHIRHGGEGAL